ncbi:MAG: DUF3426 domain-containing protein [Alphaproteobacteria bacterium]|nr:DUF3426 domain-containing protein [Alphaproteobacteria bacterium]
MILSCPSCGTRYQADGARFAAPGRNVRCAKCAHVWFQTPPAAEIEPEPEPIIHAPPQPESFARSVEPPRELMSPRIEEEPMVSSGVFAEPEMKSPRSKGALVGQLVGWAALIIVVVAVGWSVVQFRQTIANLWPQSASLYAALGMPVNLRGIALTDVAYQQEFEDGLPVLSVTGKVVNVSDRELPVPELQVVLTDDARRELYHWTFDAGVPSLKPGAESAFTTRLSSPPADARNLNIRFAEAEGAAAPAQQ